MAQPQVRLTEDSTNFDAIIAELPLGQQKSIFDMVQAHDNPNNLNKDADLRGIISLLVSLLECSYAPPNNSDSLVIGGGQLVTQVLEKLSDAGLELLQNKVSNQYKSVSIQWNKACRVEEKFFEVCQLAKLRESLNQLFGKIQRVRNEYVRVRNEYVLVL